MVFCLCLLMLPSKDARSVWRTHSRAVTQVLTSNTIPTTQTALFRFIQEAVNTPRIRSALFCENINLSLSLCLLSFTPNSPPFSPQENISIPACNALWLRCCLYLRKHFCVSLASCVYVLWAWCICIISGMLACVCEFVCGLLGVSLVWTAHWL